MSLADRVVRHPPDAVWPLLVDPAMWRLCGFVYGFDIDDAPAAVGPVRVLCWRNGDGSLLALPFRVTVNDPQRRFVVTYASEHVREWTLDLRIRPVRRGARVQCRAKLRQGGFWGRFRMQRNWDHRLSGLLYGLALVLAGQWERPAASLPVEQALALPAPHPADRAPVTASAEVEVALPADRAWDLAWDPATQLRGGGELLHAGHVPGTPVQAVGELQYFLSEVDGHLVVRFVAVTAIERGRSATTAALGYPFEIDYLIEPAPTAGRSRLGMTWRYWAEVNPDELQRECETNVELQRRLVEDAAGVTGA